ncbi:hypothetical protein ACTFIY_003896 [Dictyostelium cf. discoideum]
MGKRIVALKNSKDKMETMLAQFKKYKDNSLESSPILISSNSNNGNDDVAFARISSIINFYLIFVLLPAAKKEKKEKPQGLFSSFASINKIHLSPKLFKIKYDSYPDIIKFASDKQMVDLNQLKKLKGVLNKSVHSGEKKILSKM